MYQIIHKKYLKIMKIKKQDPQTVITSGENVKDYMSKAETLMPKGKKDEYNGSTSW